MPSSGILLRITAKYCPFSFSNVHTNSCYHNIHYFHLNLIHHILLHLLGDSSIFLADELL